MGGGLHVRWFRWQGLPGPSRFGLLSVPPWVLWWAAAVCWGWEGGSWVGMGQGEGGGRDAARVRLASLGPYGGRWAVETGTNQSRMSPPGGLAFTGR